MVSKPVVVALMVSKFGVVAVMVSNLRGWAC